MTPNSMSRHSDNSAKKGDNCHLLYALKGKAGLTTDVTSIKNLMGNFIGIVDDISKISNEYDLIISMPSNHNISHIFGKRLSKKFGCSHLKNVFEKISRQDAENLLKGATVDHSVRKKLQGRLRQIGNNEKFSLKIIPGEHRHIFPPLKIGKLFPFGVEYKKIMLADDLLSTGTTLVEASRLIKQVLPNAEVDAACLFGAVGD